MQQLSNDEKYLISKIEKIGDVLDIELSHAKGKPVFYFKPGQYAMISYIDETGARQDKHAFSLASSPGAKDRLRFGIKIMGRFTQGLAKLKAGGEIFVSGPFGKFVFDAEKHRDLVLIAGGIGITPFLSAMKYAAGLNLPNRLSLIYSNKTLAGTLFYDEIIELQKRHENLRALFCVTDDQAYPQNENIFNGRISAKLITQFIGQAAGKTFFICGPANFMAAVKETLIGLGADERQIEMEQFTMIPDVGFRAVIKNAAYAIGFSLLIMLLPLYFIFKSSQNPPLNKNSGLFSFFSYDSAKLYNLAKQAYSDMLLAKQVNGQYNANDQENILPAGSLPVARDAATSSADLAPAARSVGSKIAGVFQSVGNFVNTARKDAASILPKKNQPAAAPAPAASGTAKQPAKSVAASQAPAPVTSASIPANEAAAVPDSVNPATSAQPNDAASAPAPVTSASAPASAPAPTPVSTSPIAVSNPTVSAPAPVTSASAPAPTPTATPALSSAPAVSSPAPAPAPTPAPVTSASGVATVPTPAPAPSPSTTPAPAPAPTPAPAPVTSASGVVTVPTPTISSPTSTPTISSPAPAPTISAPAPAPAPVRILRPRRQDRDDDYDDD